MGVEIGKGFGERVPSTTVERLTLELDLEVNDCTMEGREEVQGVSMMVGRGFGDCLCYRAIVLACMQWSRFVGR